MLTTETYHVSVLLKESVDGLVFQPDGIYVDATFGGGGHSREVLRRLSPKGRLFGFDQDADAERNIVKDDRFTFIRSNFRYLKNWMRYHSVVTVSPQTGQLTGGLDGVLADLGVSSHHFDDANRGFSFRFDAPLDMRMNRRAGITAADVVNDYDEARLADVLYLYGELKHARRLAAAIVKARQRGRIETTGQLLQVIDHSPLTIDNCSASEGTANNGQRSMVNGQWKKDAAKLFQALRIEVNHEMDALRELLLSATELLKPGGRLVVLTYHSLEDRIVKNVMRSGNVEGRVEQDFFGRVSSPLRMVNNKVVTPSDEEMQANPRSRSAKLRVAEKI